MKIYIIGVSGSGKSTLAKKLSQKLNIPHIDLDNVFYPPPNTTIEKELAKIFKIEQWIAEGFYYHEAKDLLDTADQIIFMDVNRQTALWRITKRYIQQVLTGQEKRGFRNFIKFFKGINNSFNNQPSHPLFIDFASKYGNKLTVINNNQQLREFFKKH